MVEDKEIGREMDCLALQHGLRALEKFPQIRLSVNMSARSIGYQRWTQVLHRFLKGDATLGERLVLELTEASVIMEEMEEHEREMCPKRIVTCDFEG